ncbi:MAG TPA: M28 family peptidase [Coriobacteriia bacterium]|nr:M28 family peptidase [Coriobacteriia bacterium]
MPQLIEYARALADEIGPRPATTDSEHRASEWLASQFGSHGLETEIQEFNSPRTYGWAYVIYHVLTLASAVVAGLSVWQGRLVWPAFAVAAISAFFMWGDLDTRWGLTRIMPKGPSQNVIARHIPRTRRGERMRRIIIVAHYDSAKASLAFAPNMVSGFATTFGLMKWCTFLTPAFILAMALPFTTSLDPWLWYATMAVSAYLLVPLVINIHRELFMPFVAGANDNASGVAAMLGVMERLIVAPDADSLATTGRFPQIRRDASAAEAAGVVPEGAVLNYSPAGSEPGELPDDFAWAEPVRETKSEKQQILDFDTIEFGVVEEKPRRSYDAPSSPPARESRTASAPAPAASEPIEVGGLDDERPSSSRAAGLLGRLSSSVKPGGKRREQSQQSGEVRDWLGVGDDFDARKAGADIGSWDKFAGEEEDDDFGWKGGWAGDDPIGDPDFAASEAARIRRRITEDVDRELTEKEIWFVATGCEEVGTYGMQAFLRDYGDTVKDSLIINIDNVGVGQLHWASAEGMARRYRAAQRLVGLARRVSRETETIIKPRVFRGLSTDATPALARGYKAISIMAFDSGGLPVNWHWKTDTSDALDEKLLETTADFIAAMVREA